MSRLLTYILRQFRVLKAVAFVTYKEWAAYRSHMLVSLLVGPVQLLVQIFIWKAVYADRLIINGLSLDQMITYYAVITIIHYIVMDFADWNLHMLIHTGLFSAYIIRPISHRFFAFSQKVGHRLLGILWEFLPVYLLFVFVFRIPLIPFHTGWALCSILLGFVMTYLINYCIGLTGFWLIKGDGIRRMIQIVNMLFQGVFVPLVFFPNLLQKILFFLPFQFASYVPTRVFIGSYALGGYSIGIPEIIGLQAAAVVIMFLLSELLLRLGIKKFTGVGI